MKRYERQLRIIGEEGQEKLFSSEITVVGAGGLGTPASIYLVCAGVGKLRIVDSGIPGESDLNRQFMYYDLRKEPKAKILAERLQEINPDVKVEYVTRTLRKGNEKEVIGKPDVIVDCLDTFSSRMILNAYAVSKRIPLVHAGVESYYGQITTVVPRGGPCLSCLFRNLKDKRGVPIFGFTAGVLGSMEAAETINVVLGTPSLVGKLLIVDLKEMKFEEVEVKRDPKCPVCSHI